LAHARAADLHSGAAGEQRGQRLAGDLCPRLQVHHVVEHPGAECRKHRRQDGPFMTCAKRGGVSQEDSDPTRARDRYLM
jgi:hypothetical protein